MTSLARFKVDYSGWSGGPGCNTLVFSTGTLTPPWDGTAVQAAYDEIHSYLGNFIDRWAPGVVATVQPVADVFDSESGDITGTVAVPTPAGSLTSTGTDGALSRGQAMCHAFYTDRYINGRRLIGRIFMGPINGSFFTSSGLLNSADCVTMQGYYDAMTSGVGVRLAVYHRPAVGTSTGGDYGDVVSVVCRTRPSNLRTRQD